MATRAKNAMLREISAAGERERTGAFDVEWDGARASLFFIFGHANHVEFEAVDGRKLVGNAALTAIVEELPAEFRVRPWRRAMVTDDTLRCTAEELMFLFRRDPTKPEGRGDGQPEPPTDADAPLTPPPADARFEQSAEAASGAGAAGAPPVPFGVADFPPLPVGRALWSDAAANVTGLAPAVPRLPDSLIVLTGTDRAGVVIITGGAVADAVYVGDGVAMLGADAAAAVFESDEGRLSDHAIDDAHLARALPMLWRLPRLTAPVPAEAIDPDGLLADLRTSGASCAILVDAPGSAGVALFGEGELVAAYSAAAPTPSRDPAALRALLAAPGAQVTLAADAGAAAPELGGASFALLEVVELTLSDAAAVPDDLLPPVETAVVIVEDDAEALVVVEAEPTVWLDDLATRPEPAMFGLPDIAEPEVALTEPPGTDDLVAPAPLAEESLAEEPLAAEAAVDEAPAVVDPLEETAVAEASFDDARVAEAAIAETPVAEEPVAEAAAVEPAAVETAPDETAAADTAAAEAYLVDEPALDARPAEPIEFVPAKVDIDINALRQELVGIAAVWLGDEDATPVAEAIAAARPGVDDFVAAIKAIGAMDIPGHEPAVVRAMAREMHFRAAEVLCGV